MRYLAWALGIGHWVDILKGSVCVRLVSLQIKSDTESSHLHSNQSDCLAVLLILAGVLAYLVRLECQEANYEIFISRV